jgi:hypothetical protein
MLHQIKSCKSLQIRWSHTKGTAHSIRNSSDRFTRHLGKLIDKIANSELQLADQRKEKEEMVANMERLNQRVDALERQPPVAQTSPKPPKISYASVVGYSARSSLPPKPSQQSNTGQKCERVANRSRQNSLEQLERLLKMQCCILGHVRLDVLNSGQNICFIVSPPT